MSLQSLVGISLERITPAKETIKRLLEALRGISPTQRFRRSVVKPALAARIPQSGCLPMLDYTLTATGH